MPEQCAWQGSGLVLQPRVLVSHCCWTRSRAAEGGEALEAQKLGCVSAPALLGGGCGGGSAGRTFFCAHIHTHMDTDTPTVCTCMCAHVHTCKYHMCTHTHTSHMCAHARTYSSHIHTQSHTCVHTYTQHARKRVHTHLLTYTHKHTCTHIHANVYTHAHTHALPTHTHTHPAGSNCRLASSRLLPGTSVHQGKMGVGPATSRGDFCPKDFIPLAWPSKPPSQPSPVPSQRGRGSTLPPQRAPPLGPQLPRRWVGC